MPKLKLYLIYIPGLGDQKVQGQQRAVRTWQWWGVSSELFVINWTDQETWQSKLNRLTVRVDSLKVEGWQVALVGASAGATAAINAFAMRQKSITGVVCIAGKVNRPDTVHPARFRTNPAFEKAIKDCPAALKKLDSSARQRILSRYGLFDEVVAIVDSRIPGARNRITPTFEHGFTIAEQITIGAPGFIRFLKRLPPV
ncbi:MAG TPA: hypothetical protein VLF79_03810 [Candidatus Saccharimonadales bacterium]|nr:hypothetical protein [Candidatus Saccharimonadales bacterium]